MRGSFRSFACELPGANSRSKIAGFVYTWPMQPSDRKTGVMRVAYRIPSSIIVKEISEDCCAVLDLDSLEHYQFKGVASELYSSFSSRNKTDRLLKRLIAAEPGKRSKIEEEYDRFVRFLMERKLLEKIESWR